MSRRKVFTELCFIAFMTLMTYAVTSGAFYKLGQYAADYLLIPAFRWAGLL